MSEETSRAKTVTDLLDATIWNSGVMRDEPVLFISDEENAVPPFAQLLFCPTEIISIRSSTYERSYGVGCDVLLDTNSNRLSLPPGSQVPSLKVSELFRPPNSEGAIDAAQGPRARRFGDDRWLRYGETPAAYFAHQVLVTYRHTQQWDGYRPLLATNELPMTIGRLRRREPVRIVLFGDSVSEGCSASRLLKSPPWFPPFGEMVKSKLESRYRAPVELLNLSKGGEKSLYAREHAAEVAAVNPDLVIIAFGINDGSHQVEPELYRERVKDAVEKIAHAGREVEFVLVSTSLANPEWTKSAPELYSRYREALQSLSRRGVAIADVTTLWDQVTQKKSHLDLTVNGVNHPNDFGHRLYAQTILGLLIG